MAQRLVRVLCKHCKAPAQDLDPKDCNHRHDPDSPEVDQIMAPLAVPNARTLASKVDAIFEFMKMNSEVRDLAFQRAPAEEIRRCHSYWHENLVDDGRLKTLAGSTTPAEVADLLRRNS